MCVLRISFSGTFPHIFDCFSCVFRAVFLAFPHRQLEMHTNTHMGRTPAQPHTHWLTHTHTRTHSTDIAFSFWTGRYANSSCKRSIFTRHFPQLPSLLRVFHVFHAISSLFSSLFSPFSRFPHTALIAFPLFLRFSLLFDDNSLIFADVFSLDSLAFATHHFSRAFNRIFQAFSMRVWLKFSKINSWFCCCRRARYVHISIDRYR